MSNDIKLTAQDQTIGYKGNVTLKLIRNGKVYKEVSEHNSGTVAFFRLMALSIAGDTSAVSEMPNYICLFNATSSTDTSPNAELDIDASKIEIAKTSQAA